MSASLSMSCRAGIGHAAGDAEIFEQIVYDVAIWRATRFAAAGGEVDHLLMEEIVRCTNQTPAATTPIGQPRFKSSIASARIYVERRATARAHRLDQQREGEHQRQKQNDEAGEQKGRAQFGWRECRNKGRRL